MVSGDWWGFIEWMNGKLNIFQMKTERLASVNNKFDHQSLITFSASLSLQPSLRSTSPMIDTWNRAGITFQWMNLNLASQSEDIDFFPRSLIASCALLHSVLEHFFLIIHKPPLYKTVIIANTEQRRHERKKEHSFQKGM